MPDTGENLGKRLVSLKVHANYVHEVIERFECGLGKFYTS